MKVIYCTNKVNFTHSEKYKEIFFKIMFLFGGSTGFKFNKLVMFNLEINFDKYGCLFFTI